AADDPAGFGNAHGLGRTPGSSGHNGLAAGLSLEEHHSEAFDIPPDLPVGQDKQIALLIAVAEPVVVHLAQELEMCLYILPRNQVLQENTCLAGADDRIKDVREGPADGG